MRTRSWAGYLVAVTPFGLAYLFTPGPLHSAIAFNLIGISSVVAIVVGIRMFRPDRQLAWWLFALGQALFVAGDVISYNYARFFGTDPPFPAVSDALYLAVYPTLGAGLVLLIARRTRGRDRSSVIDALVVAIGLGVVSWVLLIAPIEHDRSLSEFAKLVSIAYPLSDVLVLGFVLRLTLGGGRRGTSFHLMSVSIAALLVTDSVYAWLLNHGGYQPGGLLDGGWIVFYVVWGAAALHPSMAKVAERTHTLTRLTFRRLALLTAAALAGPAVSVIQALRDQPSEPNEIAISSAILFLLVMARMVGLTRTEQQVTVRREEARFAALVENSSDVIAIVAADTTITYVSPSAHRVLGYLPEDLIGRRLADANSGDGQGNGLVYALATVPKPTRGRAEKIETVIHRGDDDRPVHCEGLVTDLTDDPDVAGYVANMRDVSEQRLFEQQLTHQAFHDPLTGLANRALFHDRVAHALDRRRTDDTTVAVVFLDIDDFKLVNDTLGHAAGDRLIVSVAERLSAGLRAADTAARHGGDEFALLLEDVADENAAAETAARILSEVRQPFEYEGKEVLIRASGGIALAGADARGETGAEELLRSADIAMYAAKDRGDSSLRIYEPTMHDAFVERRELRSELEAAIENGDLELHYQPIVDLQTYDVSGFEALLRWRHAARGVIPPAQFIPLAEESGLILPIGSWVLDTACLAAVRFRQTLGRPDLTISVNVSGKQLLRAEIVDEVRNALAGSGLPPSGLVLELTESVMMQDIELSTQLLRELKGLGVLLAVDDFGTGYSSLNYIQHFPVDILKLDKSFVDELTEGGDAARLTEAIIGLAGILQLQPVGEGIEREEQADQLRRLRCSHGQGYLFAKPLPIAEAISVALISGSRAAAA